MENNHHTPLTDDHLQSLQGMKPAEINPFFYTKLKGRMEQQFTRQGFFFKPVWVIGTLVFFLTINVWMIVQKGDTSQQTAEKKSAEQLFAETYNLNSDSNY